MWGPRTLNADDDDDDEQASMIQNPVARLSNNG